MTAKRSDRKLRVLLYRGLQGFRARLHQASASTQNQRCDDASGRTLIEINWNKYSCFRMGLQPILKRLHSFQWERRRKRHRKRRHSVDADAGVNGLLKLHLYWAKVNVLGSWGQFSVHVRTNSYSNWNAAIMEENVCFRSRQMHPQYACFIACILIFRFVV